jgi:hypothetical protein
MPTFARQQCAAYLNQHTTKPMTGLTSSGLRVAVPIVLLILGVQTCHAELPASPVFNEEASKQSGIYQSRGAAVPEGYVIDRSLMSYAFTLSPEFNRSLADLGPADRWLDIGAGEGRAILDYCTSKYDAMHVQAPERRGMKAKATALSIEDRRTVHWHRTAATLEAKQIEYLFGKRLRDYSQEELGHFQIITDVMGGFSYAQNLSVFMEKTLGFLDLNGSFYTVLQDVRSEQGTNRPYYPNAPYLTQIKDAAGSEVRMCSWLKNIACVEVTCEFKAEWSPPIEVYRIRKVCNDVSVPALMPTHFAAGTPPERGFQLKSPVPAAPERAGAAR